MSKKRIDKKAQREKRRKAKLFLKKLPFKKVRGLVRMGRKVNKHRKKLGKVVYVVMYLFTNWNNRKVKY